MKSSKNVDLILPNERYNFPGLQTGDRWCLCLENYIDAKKHRKAPPVIADATAKGILGALDVRELAEVNFKTNNSEESRRLNRMNKKRFMRKPVHHNVNTQ